MMEFGQIYDIPPGSISADPIGHPYAVMGELSVGEVVLCQGSSQPTEASRGAVYLALDPGGSPAYPNRLKLPTLIYPAILQRMPLRFLASRAPIGVIDPTHLRAYARDAFGFGAGCVGDPGVRKDSLRGRIIPSPPIHGSQAVVVMTAHDYSAHPAALQLVVPIVFAPQGSVLGVVAVRLRGLSMLADSLGRQGESAHALPTMPVTLRPRELESPSGIVVDTSNMKDIERILSNALTL